jgi:hypothetical protein
VFWGCSPDSNCLSWGSGLGHFTLEDGVYPAPAGSPKNLGALEGDSGALERDLGALEGYLGPPNIGRSKYATETDPVINIQYQ